MSWRPTVPLNPGTYMAIVSFAGDADHLGSTAGPVTINITHGACSVGSGPRGVILPPINCDGSSDNPQGRQHDSG